MIDRIAQRLMDSRHVLLATHVDPDGDAIGSLIALGLALDRLGKKTTLYNESSIPAVYRFLPSIDWIVKRVDDMTGIDVAVVLDCGDLDRIGQQKSMLKDVTTVINIDHHVTNTGFGDYAWVDVGACATSELVYRLIRKMGAPMTRALATALYTGILTDTGSFRFSNTNRSAFQICAELMESGVDPSFVAQNVYGKYSLGRLKLLNLALDSIEISDNGKLSMMVLTQAMLKHTNTRQEDLDGLINYARSIEHVKVAALIHDLGPANGNGSDDGPRNFHVSLRSNGTFDVSMIAAAFGGGGHQNAAGFSIEATLAELKSEIVKLFEKL